MLQIVHKTLARKNKLPCQGLQYHDYVYAKMRLQKSESLLHTIKHHQHYGLNKTTAAVLGRDISKEKFCVNKTGRPTLRFFTHSLQKSL